MAFLVHDDLCNRLAPVTLRCRNYGFGLRVLRLPPHVSLKQPFIVADFDRFEAYFDGLAARIEPQSIVFDRFQFWGDADQGVVSLRVIANRRLRELHAQINAELAHEFGGTQAEHDGDDYDFHLTVAIGSCRAESLPQLCTEIATWPFDERTAVTKLALFVYEESECADALYGVREYGVYKVQSLKMSSKWTGE